MLLVRGAAGGRLEAGVGTRMADDSCDGATGMVLGREVTAGLCAGDRLGRVLLAGTGCFRGRPGPLLFTGTCD